MQSKRELKEKVSQSKPFNRLIEFGFTPEVLKFVEERKNDVAGKLNENLQQKQKRVSDVEDYYKKGVYTKDRYLKEKKKAKEGVVEAKKKIKNLSMWQSDELLAHASNVLNPGTENAMTSKFSGTSYIESKAKLLLPHIRESGTVINDEGYKNAWREILKSESREHPIELAKNIKLVEVRRQAIMDLLDYYKIDNVSSIKKNKSSVLCRMLENIDNDLKELNKRLKDPKYDFEIRLQEATTNEANKVVLGDYAKRRRIAREKRQFVKELKESIEKGTEALNMLKIDKPSDESRLFTPSVGLIFRSQKSVSTNPLQLNNTAPEQKTDRRKSMQF